MNPELDHASARRIADQAHEICRLKAERDEAIAERNRLRAELGGCRDMVFSRKLDALEKEHGEIVGAFIKDRDERLEQYQQVEAERDEAVTQICKMKARSQYNDAANHSIYFRKVLAEIRRAVKENYERKSAKSVKERRKEHDNRN